MYFKRTSTIVQNGKKHIMNLSVCKSGERFNHFRRLEEKSGTIKHPDIVVCSTWELHGFQKNANWTFWICKIAEFYHSI